MTNPTETKIEKWTAAALARVDAAAYKAARYPRERLALVAPAFMAAGAVSVTGGDSADHWAPYGEQYTVASSSGAAIVIAAAEHYAAAADGIGLVGFNRVHQ